MKSGYLYVFSHPSNSQLIKVGYTSGTLKKALEIANTEYSRDAGKLVKETGKKWRMLKNVKVPDPSYAKAIFWEVFHPYPFRGKEDIMCVNDPEWKHLESCLNTAKNAGIRPPKRPKIVSAFRQT